MYPFCPLCTYSTLNIFCYMCILNNRPLNVTLCAFNIHILYTAYFCAIPQCTPTTAMSSSPSTSSQCLWWEPGVSAGTEHPTRPKYDQPPSAEGFFCKGAGEFPLPHFLISLISSWLPSGFPAAAPTCTRCRGERLHHQRPSECVSASLAAA